MRANTPDPQLTPAEYAELKAGLAALRKKYGDARVKWEAKRKPEGKSERKPAGRPKDWNHLELFTLWFYITARACKDRNINKWCHNLASEYKAKGLVVTGGRVRRLFYEADIELDHYESESRTASFDEPDINVVLDRFYEELGLDSSKRERTIQTPKDRDWRSYSLKERLFGYAMATADDNLDIATAEEIVQSELMMHYVLRLHPDSLFDVLPEKPPSRRKHRSEIKNKKS